MHEGRHHLPMGEHHGVAHVQLYVDAVLRVQVPRLADMLVYAALETQRCSLPRCVVPALLNDVMFTSTCTTLQWHARPLPCRRHTPGTA
jgi:hypothetical protein